MTEPLADPAPATGRRALVFAGGGVKVAFQAGVLQVWLDEAGLDFDLADAASGGCFNCAMWCQGMSGTEIADNWRRLDPRAGVDFNWTEYLKLFYAESLFTLDRYRENVFPGWGLDFEAIRAGGREATFNVYNFSRHELRVVPAHELTEDLLVASVSLPMWFPPVEIEGDTYIDAVFRTDANLEEAIRRGADELWVIWTVSRKGEWQSGFVAQYFQIIEAASNGIYKSVLERIERSNRALAEGRHSEFGRHITVRELEAEVPVHYLVNFSRDRFAEAVERGVEAARAWCREEGIELVREGPCRPMPPSRDEVGLSFRETMRGYADLGEDEPRRGFERGRRAETLLEVRLRIEIDSVDRFVVDPEHEAAVSGTVSFPSLGGERPIERGVFNLLVDEGDPAAKRMLYRLFFRDAAGNPFTLSGTKVIEDDPGLDAWSDTTTLFTRLLRGHVEADEEAAATVVGAGVVRISLPGFLRQLTTFEAEGGTLADRAEALRRFGQLFLGKLWDVYAREVLSSGPF